jgi:hypothetical protein
MSFRVAMALVRHAYADEMEKLPWEWTEEEVAKRIGRSKG